MEPERWSEEGDRGQPAGCCRGSEGDGSPRATFGLSYKQVVDDSGQGSFWDVAQGAELRVLGRRALGREGRQWMEAVLFRRDRRGRRASAGRSRLVMELRDCVCVGKEDPPESVKN